MGGFIKIFGLINCLANYGYNEIIKRLSVIRNTNLNVCQYFHTETKNEANFFYM